MTDIVKYNNEMNTYPVFKLSEVEQDIFMALLSKTTFNGKQTIRANLRDLQSMVEFSRTSIDDFEQKANSLILKICNPKFSLISDEKIVVFVCFDRLEYNRKTYDLEVHIQDDFYAMMKNYKLGFTRFELAEFVNLSGSYAKTLYRLLKQYRTSGSWIVTVEDFRQLLNVPKTYRQREIDTRVLNPCIKQLSRELDMFDTVRVPFRNLKCEKIKKRGRGVKGRGGTITHYAFTFDAEKRELIEQSQEELQPQFDNPFLNSKGLENVEKYNQMSDEEFMDYYCKNINDNRKRQALTESLTHHCSHQGFFERFTAYQQKLKEIEQERNSEKRRESFNSSLNASLKTKPKK